MGGRGLGKPGTLLNVTLLNGTLLNVSEQPLYGPRGEGASRTPSGECADADGSEHARQHGGASAGSQQRNATRRGSAPLGSAPFTTSRAAECASSTCATAGERPERPLPIGRVREAERESGHERGRKAFGRCWCGLIASPASLSPLEGRALLGKVGERPAEGKVRPDGGGSRDVTDRPCVAWADAHDHRGSRGYLSAFSAGSFVLCLNAHLRDTNLWHARWWRRAMPNAQLRVLNPQRRHDGGDGGSTRAALHTRAASACTWV